MPRCERCGHSDSLIYTMSLVNADPAAFEEGVHVADVELRLCSECEQEVADDLLVIVSALKHESECE